MYVVAQVFNPKLNLEAWKEAKRSWEAGANNIKPIEKNNVLLKILGQFKSKNEAEENYRRLKKQFPFNDFCVLEINPEEQWWKKVNYTEVA
jgi:hypothetical protein